jgi:hypothetical protein
MVIRYFDPEGRAGKTKLITELDAFVATQGPTQPSMRGCCKKLTLVTQA